VAKTRLTTKKSCGCVYLTRQTLGLAQWAAVLEAKRCATTGVLSLDVVH